LEANLRDIELELDSERKNHAETIKILRKKERLVKEMSIQIEEDQKNVLILQEQFEKANGRLQQYKRQLSEQASFSIVNFSSITNIFAFLGRTFCSNRHSCTSRST